MDKLSLAKLKDKVEIGEILLKRIQFLEGFKKKLNAEKGILTIDVLEGGYSCHLEEGTDKACIFAKYKDFVLDGVNTEIDDLQAQFDEL